MMAGEYEAVLTADTSGYTKNVQQALAVTQQFVKANEGLSGSVGRVGSAAILKVTEALGLQTKAMKANVAEAARYQQALGKVSAQAVAAGKSVDEAQKTTKSIARQITGDLGSAVASVSAAQKMGFTGTDQIKSITKSMVELSAATGDSGSAITQSLTQINRSFGQMAAPQQITDLGDALTTVTAKFGGSAEEVANFSSQLAPFAKQVGMSQTQLLAFSTAFARQGEGGYRSANVMSKMLTDIDEAVRKGGPALSVYARTMGMTYDEALKFASKDAGGFFITFMDALGKQGPEAVRTLEQLGLEGVRTQRSIAALSASPVRDMVAAAQTGYGTGATAEAAEQQLTGLTEETAKLEESLRQVVVASGEPFLGWMESVTSGASKAADGLAQLVDSKPFQMILAILAGGGIAAKVGGSLLGGMYTATSIGGMAGLLGRNVGGAVSPLRQGMNWVGQNRMMTAGIGAAGLTAGMMGVPGANMLGMGALLLASGMGGTMFRGGQAGWNFLTADAKHLALTPASKWISEAGGGRASRLAAYEMAMAGTLAATGGPVTGRFRQAAMRRLYRPDIDLYEQSRASIKGFTTEQVTQAERDVLQRSRGYVTAGGKGLLFAPDYQRITQLAGQNEFGKLSSAIKDLDRSMNNQMLIRGGAVVGAMPEQTAAARMAFAGRNIGTTMGAMAAGFPIQLAGLLANPLALGIAGVAGLGGAAIYTARKRGAEYEAARTPEVAGVNAFREQYGLEQINFTGLAAATDNLKSAFDNLASSFEEQAGKVKEGGEYNIAPGEFAALTPNTNIKLRYQTSMLANWGIGAAGTNPEELSPEAVAEIAKYLGPNPTPEGQAAVASILAGNKFTAPQASAVITAATKQMQAGPQAALAPFTALYEQVFAEARAATPSGVAGLTREEVLSGAEARALAMAPQNTPQLEAAKAAVYGSAQSTEKMTRDVVDSIVSAGETYHWSAGEMSKALHDAADKFQIDIEEGFQFTEGGNFREQAYQELGRRYGRTQGAQEAGLVGAGFIGAPTTAEERRTQERGMTDVQRAVAWFAQQSSAGQFGVTRPELLFQGPTRQGMDTETATKLQDAAEGLTTFQSEFIKVYKEENKAQTRQYGISYAGQMRGIFGGAGSIQELQAQQRRFGYTGAAGELAGAGLAEAQRQRQTELAGMPQPVAIQAQALEAITTITDIQREQAAGGTIDQQATQDQLNTAMDNLQNATDQYIGYMQTYLKAKKGFDRQMGYMAEDFERQKRYAEEDYATQREQATAQHQLQMRYQQEDYQRSVMLADRDFKKAMARAERDYNKQIERMAEEHGIQMERLAKDAAKAAMDPYQRMNVQQTWSMGGIAQNMREQLQAAQDQLENLQKLRDAGLSRDAISQLGLNDTKNAMQVQQFVWDMASGGANIEDLNKLAQDRISVAGELFGPEWDESAKRAEEDYQRGLDHMAEDRRQWLADSTADYQQQMADNEVAFQTAQKRANEQFEIQMRYMEEAYNRSLDRMNEANATAVRRAAESFEAQFEVMTTNFDKLNAAYQTALAGGIPDWNSIIASGTKDLGTQLANAFGKIDLTYVDQVAKLAKDRYGADSNLSKMLLALAATIGGATGGGPWGEDFPESAAPATASGSITAGIGRVTQVWNNPGTYGPNHNGPHTGVDIGVSSGTPVYLKEPGKVTNIINSGSSGYGLHVIVQDNDEKIRLLYAHLSSVGVHVGQDLKAGAFVGTSGYSGNVRPAGIRGAHLHFEARHPPYDYGDDLNPGKWMWQGGIVQQPTKAMVGEGGFPEAVIPLNHRGIDVLAKALAKAYGTDRQVVQGGQVMSGNITYVTNEDHSVTVSGPISVTTDDPDRMARELERKAKQRALVAPRR
jgi:TP901 family phage tail tape measure protein